MKGLIEAFLEKEDLSLITSGLDEKLKEQMVAGISGSARSVFITSLHKKTKRPILVVTYNLLQAQKLYDDFVQLNSEEDVYLYPANELVIADLSIASPELKAQRIDVLNSLSKNEKGIIIVPLAGLRKILPPKELWQKYLLEWKVDEDIDLLDTLDKLVRMGYERVDMVSSPGEFSIRGGIIDIYPLTEEHPIRIELFDDIIDSIRNFEIDTQRSIDKRKAVTVAPVNEFVLENEHMDAIIERLEEKLAKSLTRLKDENLKELLVLETKKDIEQLENGQLPESVFKYLSLAYDSPASLLDYLPDDAIICIDEISRVVEIRESLDKEEAEWKTSLLGEGKIVHDLDTAHDIPRIMQKSKCPILYFSLFLRHVPNTNPQNIINIAYKQMQNFHGQMPILKNEVERWKKAGFTIVFLGENEKRTEKLASVFDDYSIEYVMNFEGEKLIPGQGQIVQGTLTSGFELPIYKLAVIVESELFVNRKKKSRTRKQKLSNAERIKSYSDLKIGDYVVHVNHGIGKYLGIETLEIDGIHRDYLKIKYKGTDQLFVPVEQIHLVQKYVAPEGKEPKLYKLGGTEWKRVRKKVESSVKDIAEDLIKLYAERQATKGYAFSPDSDLQREFEASFPYKETEDQLRSVEEIKRDMERPRPMDRLLCGDVGYGKTEVALRAAFKAIVDGKQVAFLVPTTILAQQHYETMMERFQDYPIKIGMLSRFRTRKEQQETIKGLKNGTIDIVVGTHRLLSKDVQFHDLGLLIIDEEQRFGVAHKEKIKQMKTNVDVLTLTATPIPRTLHMSMLGVRDLSVLETPPENRFPVQTYVMEHNPSLVKEAIERELARDGQVYYLYNRVEDIERKAEEISMLVPDARITYAHGQMSETELESVILSFLNGEFDVLVTTTIIETGVDIPNVNTLIVENADRMGLSQLYQLRGRVGRSNRIAYAYFMYQRDKVLSEVAEKRLQTIKEFTELGSGFKIAMRDLSIRGTGNILGAQQSGFIESVGFDLYSQMLKEAIDKLKGEKVEEEDWEIEIDLGIDAYIPDSYISDSYQKIEMYKRFRAIQTLEEIQELQDELIDRFGDYPTEVDYLFKISRYKVFGKAAGVESIKRDKNQVMILFRTEDSKQIDIQEVVAVSQSFKKMVGFGMEGDKLKILLYLKGEPVYKWMDVLDTIMEHLPKKDSEKIKTTL